MQAKNLHYGLDFCPAFWEWIINNNAAGRVFSIEKVGDEIEAGNDELAVWAEQRGSSLFVPPDQSILPVLPNVSTWATTYTWGNGQRYSPAAINTFLQVADYYLVAQALAKSYVVVTHEKLGTTVNKIKIPNACIGLGIKCMTPFEMLRVERTRFILEGAHS